MQFSRKLLEEGALGEAMEATLSIQATVPVRCQILILLGCLDMARSRNVPEKPNSCISKSPYTARTPQLLQPPHSRRCYLTVRHTRGIVKDS